VSKYDFLIVGSGLFGSVFANQAIKAGKTCLVIDKRSHIGGNCFTENVEGINVHKYGPHIFHTSNDEIWKFVNQFVEFKQFTYQPVAKYKNELFTLPFNMWTFHQLWGVKTPEEARRKIEETRVHVENPRNLEEWALSQVGKDVYEKLIYGYTKKQWQREPKDLPSFIIKRLPIRFTYDLNYYNDKYVGIPVGGYTKMMTSLLEGAHVQTGVDYFQNRDTLDKMADKIVYTGKIDEYFDYMFGDLQYRTLDFDHQILDTENHQGCTTINYTDELVPYTRSIEHKHFEGSKSEKTVVSYETPSVWARDKVPYYPINDEQNNSLFIKYKKEAQDLPRVFFGGRLADYKYYDMHQVIGSALSRSKRILK
jgi:UDP-galactopyranose mutase